MCWTPLLTNTNNINMTGALLQPTGGDDEPNITTMCICYCSTQSLGRSSECIRKIVKKFYKYYREQISYSSYMQIM